MTAQKQPAGDLELAQEFASRKINLSQMIDCRVRQLGQPLAQLIAQSGHDAFISLLDIEHVLAGKRPQHDIFWTALASTLQWSDDDQAYQMILEGASHAKLTDTFENRGMPEGWLSRGRIAQLLRINALKCDNQLCQLFSEGELDPNHHSQTVTVNNKTYRYYSPAVLAALRHRLNK